MTRQARFERTPELVSAVHRAERIIDRCGPPPAGKTYCAVLVSVNEYEAMKTVVDMARMLLELPIRKKGIKG